MKKTANIKLALSKETIRRLVQGDLGEVVGGRTPQETQTCFTCPTHNCTPQCPTAFPCPSLNEPC